MKHVRGCDEWRRDNDEDGTDNGDTTNAVEAKVEACWERGMILSTYCSLVLIPGCTDRRCVSRVDVVK